MKAFGIVTLCIMGPVALPLLFGASLSLTLIILGCFMLLGAWILRLLRAEEPKEPVISPEELEIRKEIARCEHEARASRWYQQREFYEAEVRELKKKLAALKAGKK